MITEATQNYILNIAFEHESAEHLLNTQLQEERILAQISELERARSIINSKYYYGRINTLCEEYAKLKKNGI